MKELKNIITTLALIIMLSTTSALNSSAITPYQYGSFNNYFITNLGATIKSLFSNVDDVIEDQLRNEYIKEILNDVLKLRGGRIGEIISKFSVGTQNWNWKIKEGELPESYNGTTELATGGVMTILDATKLAEATNIAIARTIIHELVHAYLSAYFRYDQPNADKDYPEILKAWQIAKNPDYNEIQHDEIEKSFVDDIASALKEYGELKGLEIEDIIYADLAWGGLDFQNSNELTEQDKMRIQLRLSAEQLNMTFDNEIPMGIAAVERKNDNGKFGF